MFAPCPDCPSRPSWTVTEPTMLQETKNLLIDVCLAPRTGQVDPCQANGCPLENARSSGTVTNNGACDLCQTPRNSQISLATRSLQPNSKHKSLTLLRTFLNRCSMVDGKSCVRFGACVSEREQHDCLFYTVVGLPTPPVIDGGMTEPTMLQGRWLEKPHRARRSPLPACLLPRVRVYGPL